MNPNATLFNESGLYSNGSKPDLFTAQLDFERVSGFEAELRPDGLGDNDPSCAINLYLAHGVAILKR
jgi:hypothetical protein